jgi:hypothetical protein
MDAFRDKDYWINLPCTISVGKSFRSAILKHMNRVGYRKVIPFINPKLKPTMDMGVISTRHIYDIRDYLLKMKLTTYTEEDIKNLKRQLIYDENMLFCLPARPEATSAKFTTKCEKMDLSNPLHFFINNRNNIKERITQKSGKAIKTTNFKTLGFKKYQRNFKGPGTEFILEL